MSQIAVQDALVNLPERKGIITRAELREEAQAVKEIREAVVGFEGRRV